MNAYKQELIRLGNGILQASRNEIYLSMRFLDLALSGLQYEMNLSTLHVGTDGESILYNPRYLAELYQSDRVLVNRLYLHLLLHCIFRHLLLRRGRNETYWNLACDIAVESIVDGMQYSCIHLTVSDRREQVYEKLREHLKVLSAEGIYRELIRWNPSEREWNTLEKEFWVDDHAFWQSQETQEQGGGQGDSDASDAKNTPPEDSQSSSSSPGESSAKQQMEREKQQQMQEKWEKISEKMKTNLETFSREIGQEVGDMLSTLSVENRERPSYRRFLQKFVTQKEEIQLNEEEWDTVFYTYGLQMYGNMPLIEALESKEVKKVEELVIAIDTSESCSRDILRKFLSETYAILKDQESFFQRFCIHILQCDAGIQSDDTITSEEELQSYMNTLEVRGQGGTDFRPAFEYVQTLIDKKEFQNLKGMLYFTDGYGIFPKKRPSYDTVFVFFQEEYSNVDVPPWAMKLLVSEEDIWLEDAKPSAQKGEYHEY